MDHNEFQLDEDLIDPFKNFLAKLSDIFEESEEDKNEEDVI